MYPWGSSLSFTTIFDEGILTKVGKNSRERFFGQRLSSARMVIECTFGCLRREMDINLKELPAVIHSCFILHNFCEIRQKAVPEIDAGYEINKNEAGGKRIRNIFVKCFE